MSQENENYKTIKINEKQEIMRLFYIDEKCLFRYDKDRNGIRYFRCIDSKCKARGKFLNNLFSRTSDAIHNHSIHEVEAEYQVAYNELKEKVTTDKRKLRVLHKEAIRPLSLEAQGLMPWKRVRRNIQRKRQKLIPSCPDMATFINLLNNDESVYNIYGRIRDQKFYLGTVRENLMIFGNIQLVKELENSFECHVDATFNITPFRTKQLLVVMAIIFGKARPILYCIMDKRTKEDYEAVFEEFKKMLICDDGKIREPGSFTCDFEQGLRKAIRNVWPDTSIRGCNYHHCQALRRKAAKTQKLSTKITGNTEHHKILNMFMRISLLPIERVNTGLELLLKFIRRSRAVAKDFEEFIEYFNSTWMKLFPKEEWVVSNYRRRTNNEVEGYNNYLKQCIPLNPAPFDFLDALIDLVHDANSTFQSDKINNHNSQSDRSKITIKLNQTLDDLSNGKINELEFLQNMAFY
jgi:MULE transposase domain